MSNVLSEKADWSLEHWPRGWVLCGTATSGGVPIEAVTFATAMLEATLGKKQAKEVMVCLSIANFVKRLRQPCCVLVFASAEAEEQWRKEIEAALAVEPRDKAWFCGCDTGLSSSLIFSVLADGQYGSTARAEVRGCPVPHDKADFGRCARLIQRFPEWRDRLPEVAAAHPGWAGIVEQWDELVRLLPETSFQAALDSAKGKGGVR